jgi:hypothetical protein
MAATQVEVKAGESGLPASASPDEIRQPANELECATVWMVTGSNGREYTACAYAKTVCIATSDVIGESAARAIADAYHVAVTRYQLLHIIYGQNLRVAEHVNTRWRKPLQLDREMARATQEQMCQMRIIGIDGSVLREPDVSIGGSVNSGVAAPPSPGRAVPPGGAALV